VRCTPGVSIDLTAESRAKCACWFRSVPGDDRRMRTRTSLLGALLISVMLMPDAQARTATTAERKACEAKIQPKLDEIDSRLRGGYSGELGERLKDRRRRLGAEKAACRKV
jgi:hypothetical protein